MYLKKLMKIFCGFLTAVIAFSCVGANQAFCAGDGEEDKIGSESCHKLKAALTIDLLKMIGMCSD